MTAGPSSFVIEMPKRIIPRPLAVIYRHSLYINTLFCVKESPKKSSYRGAGPLLYDLIEIMAKLIFYSSGIFSPQVARLL